MANLSNLTHHIAHPQVFLFPFAFKQALCYWDLFLSIHLIANYNRARFCGLKQRTNKSDSRKVHERMSIDDVN